MRLARAVEARVEREERLREAGKRRRPRSGLDAQGYRRVALVLVLVRVGRIRHVGVVEDHPACKGPQRAREGAVVTVLGGARRVQLVHAGQQRAGRLLLRRHAVAGVEGFVGLSFCLLGGVPQRCGASLGED